MSSKSNRQARTFFVETRFQRMARRTGGVPRAQAVKNAEATIEENKPEFEAWLDQELQALAGLIGNARAGHAGPEWHDTACSRTRQLRDVGATMGFDLVTFVADNLCEILEGTHAGSEHDMELINCHVDCLFLARQEQYRNLRPEQLPQLSGGLRRVVESMRRNQKGAPKRKP